MLYSSTEIIAAISESILLIQWQPIVVELGLEVERRLEFVRSEKGSLNVARLERTQLSKCYCLPLAAMNHCCRFPLYFSNGALLESPINFPTMSDAIHEDDLGLVIDLVDDPIFPDTDSPIS